MLKTKGFHHITMVSADIQRTLAFYRDLLGVALVKRTVNFDDPLSHHLYFGDAVGNPGTLLTFFDHKGRSRGRFGVGSVHHLALGTANADTQRRWKRRLVDAGVPVSGPFNRGYFRSIYFADPDGQILEIATRGPGYDVDEPSSALGAAEVPPPATAQVRGARDDAAIRADTWPEPVPVIASDMTLEGIHHISCITDDLVRADEFYDRALGLRLVKRTFNQDDPSVKHWFWARYDGAQVAPHSALTFFGWPPGSRAARPGAGLTHHIAFRADTEAEQLAWRDQLLALGIAVTPVMDRSYFRSIYFADPDGLILEIATDGPGFLTDEPADRLGQALQLPAWLEAGRAGFEAGLAPLP